MISRANISSKYILWQGNRGPIFDCADHLRRIFRSERLPPNARKMLAFNKLEHGLTGKVIQLFPELAPSGDSVTSQVLGCQSVQQTVSNPRRSRCLVRRTSR